MQMVQKWLANRDNQLLVWWLMGGLLFRGFIAIFLYPGFDESYYYVYSQNLNWSYFDHPVLVALVTGFGTWLTGDVSQFTIRLGTLILHTGSLLLLYLTSVRLFSIKAARLTLAIASISPIFLIAFGILTLPDNPLMFFWTASLYCASCEFFGQNNTLSNSETAVSHPYRPSYKLAILSILVGLACLGKYHGFVLGLGLVGFCLISPNHRCVFRSVWAWLGLGLFIITTSPFWLWNMQHDWVSLRFQSERGVPKRSYNILDVVLIFLVQVAYLFPTIGLPLWWVSWQESLKAVRQILVKKIAKTDDSLGQKRLLILSVSLPVIVGFTLIAGYQQVLPAWPMPGFWGITLLLGQQATNWQKRWHLGIQRWLKGSTLIIGTALMLALLHVTTGTLQKPSQYALLGGFVSPKDDPSTELIDIQQLRRGFVESKLLSTALENSSFIFTNGYYLAGSIGMALMPSFQKPVTCFSLDMRGFAFWSKPDQWLGKDALYITISRFQKKNEITAEFQTYFNSLEEIGTVPIRRGGAVTEVFYVYQAKKLLKPYPRIYGL